MPVPAELVTWIGPVVAVGGTVAVICVSEFTVKLATTVLKVTLVLAVKPLPVMVTVVPTGPLVGVKEVTTGTTVTTKLDELVPVPEEVVTWIAPVVAPVGTVAVICASVFTVKLAAVPAKFTAVAPVKPLPVMVTVVPTGPFIGVKEVIEGVIDVPACLKAAMMLEHFELFVQLVIVLKPDCVLETIA